MRILIISIVLCGLYSCKKKPVACIASMVDKFEINDTVAFIANCSENGFGYNWDFGDGSSSEEKNPEHVYTMSGNYDVELQVYSKKNKSFDSAIRNITVKDRPVSVTITSIVLTSFPAVNWAGNLWDFQGAPDIRFQIVEGTTIYLDGIEIGQDQSYDQSYTYYSDFPVTLPYSSSYLINVLDNDGASDDLMSVLNFNPSMYSLDDEASVTIIEEYCTITLKLQWGY